MTHFLANDQNPTGYKLEDILAIIRADIVKRATKIVDDRRPEARQVMDNNIRILALLSEAITLAEESTRVLEKSFGPSVDGKPRIGKG